MPFCTKCGNQFKDGANFCAKCGASLNIKNVQQTNSTQQAVQPQQAVQTQQAVQPQQVIQPQPYMQSVYFQSQGRMLKKFDAGGKRLYSAGYSIFFAVIFLLVALIGTVFVAANADDIRWEYFEDNTRNIMSDRDDTDPVAILYVVFGILGILGILTLISETGVYRNCKNTFLCVCEDRIYGCGTSKDCRIVQQFQFFYNDIREVKNVSGRNLLVVTDAQKIWIGLKHYKDALKMVESMMKISEKPLSQTAVPDSENS